MDKPEFTYNEWHLLWRAVEARATFYWSKVEQFQIATNQNGDDQTDLWIHFLELAEEQTALLNKVEKMANAHFPKTNKEPFPNPPVDELNQGDEYPRREASLNKTHQPNQTPPT